MRTVEQITAEIEERFGFLPPFFAPALHTPQVLENLWQQTLAAYIENPLPALFKEKLSAYLSRFCPVPYCLVCHSCSLHALGMQAHDILTFLETEPPQPQQVDDHLQVLVAQNDLLKILSDLNSVLEESLLYCAIFIALDAEGATLYRHQLRHLLGIENYQYLITFIAYVKTCHEWLEAHPEVPFAADQRVQIYFQPLVEAEPALAEFFQSYWQRIQQEQISRVSSTSSVHLLHPAELPATDPSNLLFAKAIDSASAGMLLTDPNQPDHPIIYLNPAFSKLTGYLAQEAVGRNCRFLQGPDTDPQVVAQIRKAIAHQQEIQTIILNYRKDGQPFWNELKISPVRSDNGELLYFLGIQTDVTEREQMQERVKLLDQSQDAIVVLNLENRILFWNSSAAQLYGWSMGEATGSYIDELLFADFSPQLREALTTVNQQGEWQGELQLLQKNREKLIIDSRWTLIRDAAGQPKSILISSTNITEKKRTELQRSQTQRFESIGTVTRGLAHDINNALAPVLMAIQLLSNKLPDQQSQQLLANLEENTRRSADVVKQVLSFVQGIEGNKRTLRLEGVLSEVETFMKQKFPRNILIRASASPDLWAIAGDRAQIQQMLMNLCENARDAMPSGGVLRISAKNIQVDESYSRNNFEAKVGPYVVVTVSDTGSGIAAEYLNRVFEPFFTTKEFGKGTGLGLSIVLGIIKGHGGFVDIHSEVGAGTQVNAHLPAIPSALGTTAVVNNEILSDVPQDLILVVEHPESSFELTQPLLDQGEYSVIVADNGIDAIAQYAQHQDHIKAVLIDVTISNKVSDIDALTLLQALQKINSNVIILLADASPSSIQIPKELLTNVKGYLNRPYNSESLSNQLQAVLSPRLLE